MNTITSRFSQLFQSAKPVPAGIYHYQTPQDAELQYRMHLRVGQDGEGLLILNASTILHLNQTAVEYAYLLIQNSPLEKAAQNISDRYQITRNEARSDFLDFKDKIYTLLEVPDLDPVSFLEMSREDPYTGASAAPYRLDCAITYQLPAEENPDLAPVRRVDRELTTGEWLKIIDEAWDFGIPHLIFTGGEPTIREDLLTLIAHAEKNGQVTGLLTNGYKLLDDKYRKELLQSGLDHLLFLLSPGSENSWKALKTILDEDLHTTVHITISPEIITNLPSIIKDAKKLGSNAISLSVSSPESSLLLQALADAQTIAAEADIPLKWDLPVPYSNHNPISIELESNQSHPPGAGKAWFYVEPDGDLLPAQGINQVLGNLRENNWNEIHKTD